MGSASGVNFVALPYHAVASDAQALIDDMGAVHVEHVQRFDTATDTWETYVPGSGATPFAILPGEGYLVKMIDAVIYSPTT